MPPLRYSCAVSAATSTSSTMKSSTSGTASRVRQRNRLAMLKATMHATRVSISCSGRTMPRL
ncbi:hypothetical protein D3C72_2491120 [compost metagenome]